MPSNNSQLKKIIDEWQEWAVNALNTKFERKNLNIKFIANNAIALIGARRTGKTFYALEIAASKQKDFLYINFEDPYFIANNSVSELDRLIEVYTEYSLEEPSLLVLDEIQNIESWERWVRKAIDLKKYQIIITGSSAKLLSSELATSLTGRSISYTIWPLSFKEYLVFKKVTKKLNINEHLAYFKSYLLEGSFPEPTLISEANSRSFELKQYFEDILNKDIIKRYEIRNTKNLYLIASYYFTNLSSQHSTHSVKKALNINTESVGDYTRYMEDAFLIFSIDRYHPNFKVQIRDPKKIYVIDTGLRNIISRSSSEDIGKLAENAVFIELKRRSKEIYYYKQDQEVDFIITENFKAKAAIQVCYSNLEDDETYNREVDSLLACLKDLKLQEGLILTKDREEVLRLDRKTIRMIPLYLWMNSIY
jgi:uncharacterized protein